MKKISIIFTILVLCVSTLLAQAPEKFNYQAVVRNASNALVTNAPVGVRVSILQGSAAGNAVYVETHTVTTNANGLLTLEIGGGEAQQGVFADINWGAGPYFLKTETDPAGGNSYSITSVQQLMSVPFALYANEAANGFSGDYNDLTNKPEIPTSVGDLTNDAGYITINDVTTISQIQSDWNQTDTLAVDFIKNKPDIKEMEMKLWEDMDIVPKLDSEYPSHNGYITSSATWSSSSTFKHWLIPVNHIRKAIITANSATASYYTFFSTYEEGGDTPTTTYATGYSNRVSIPAGTTKEIIVPSDALWMYLNTGSNGTAKADSILLTGIGITEHRGTSSQFVKADGSVDNNTYLTQHQDISGKANTADLATVAFSGSYNDLSNKPTIPAAQVNSDWNATSGVAKILNKPNLATVATSGSYNDLTNKPTIPADNDLVHIAGNETITGNKKVTSDFTVKSTTSSGATPFLTFQRGTATDSYVDWKINDEGGALQFTYSKNGDDTKKFDINNTRALFANNVEAAKFVKTGGTSSQFLKADGSVDNNTYLTQQDISGKANTADLANVAFSGSYNDLSNTPTIPTVNNAKLTVKQNGSTLGTFTANQSSNKTINITTLTLDDVQSLINSSLGAMQQHNDSVQGAIHEQLDNMQDVVDSLQDVVDALTGVKFKCGISKIKDIDGNEYNTVQIGNQCWMKENLRTTHYADGTEIPAGGDAYSGTEPYYYDYVSSDIPLVSRGYLYNRSAMMHGAASSDAVPSGVQGVCPTGWHVPSRAEWTLLTDYVSSRSEYICGDNSDYIAKALASSEGWYGSPTTCAIGNNKDSNNATGFSAIPAGYNNGSSFFYSKIRAYYWTSTYSISTIVYYYTLSFSEGSLGMFAEAGSSGMSVRCLRDVTFVVDEKSCPGTPTVTDVDGNEYSTVQIGDQCWMRENLRTTKYADATPISLGSDTSSTTPYYYDYSSHSLPLVKRGYLYNWLAVMHGAVSSDANPSGVQGICPTGWHVPSDAEWTQLADYVVSIYWYVCGGGNTISKSLASTEGWETSTYFCSIGNNQSSNNATGFEAFPAGIFYNSLSQLAGGNTYFYSSTANSNNIINSRSLSAYSQWFYQENTNKNHGCSVRCLRD